MGQSGDWKNELANEASKALEHELVREVMQEFADNMGFKLEGLPRYGLMKVASYTAQVARAQAVGIDPDELRYSDAEANAATQKQARLFVAAGKPVISVEPDGTTTRLD